MVAATLTGACGICADDFDRDGDTDALGAADFGNKVAWWENTPDGIEEARSPARPTHLGPTLASGHLRPAGALVYDVSGRRVNSRSLKPGLYFFPDGGKATGKVVEVR